MQLRLNLPEDVAGLVVEDVFESGGSVHHVASDSVKYSLRLPGGATRVQEE